MRPFFGQKAAGLQGLLNLETASGKSIDEVGSLGDFLGGQLTRGGASPWNTTGGGKDLARAALAKAQEEKAAGKQLTGLFGPGGDALQRDALTAALRKDIAPSLYSTVDDVVAELNRRFQTQLPGDPNAQTKTGSIFELAKQLGII